MIKYIINLNLLTFRGHSLNLQKKIKYENHVGNSSEVWSFYFISRLIKWVWEIGTYLFTKVLKKLYA